MNWKEEAAEKLRRYDAMRHAVKNIPLELKRLQLEATSIRSAAADSAPVKGGISRREDRLMNNLAQRQALQETLSRTKCWLRTADDALGTLTQQERQILQRLYIFPEKGALDRLCQELDMEKSSVYRYRDRALHRFATALYGFPES